MKAAPRKTTAARIAYRISDQLFLWLVTVPGDPILIGELNMVRSTRGVSLRYADSWIQYGFALSEDLPLVGEEFLPTTKDTAAGAVDDARPDRWGERVIKVLDKPPRLSLLEYLYFAGDDRMRVGRDQADSTLANAMSMCASFGLTTDEAAREVRVVIGAIGRWKAHFRSCGVTARDIEALAEQVDRPFLRAQRREF
jgi:hypothetical protein